MKTLILTIMGMVLFLNIARSQSVLKKGDIAFVAFKASASVDSLSFVVLAEQGLQSGTEVLFTDNAWVYKNGSGFFRTGEGIIKWRSTREHFYGEVVSFFVGSGTNVGANTGLIEKVFGSFSLSSTGDQVFAFQGSWPEPTVLICGLNYYTNAQTNEFSWNTDTSSSAMSALPTASTGAAPQWRLDDYSAIWLRQLQGQSHTAVRAARWKGISNSDWFSSKSKVLRTMINQNSNWGDFQLNNSEQPAWLMPTAIAIPPISCSFQYQMPSCWNTTDGRILAMAAGGNGKLSYQWLGRNETSKSLEFIGGGSYSLKVSDQLGNTLQCQAVLAAPPIIESNAQILSPCEGADNGAIRLAPSGGTGQLSIRWENGTNENYRQGLDKGVYEVQISDAHYCVIKERFDLNEQENQTYAGVSSDTICPGDTVYLSELIPSFRESQGLIWWVADNPGEKIVSLVHVDQICMEPVQFKLVVSAKTPIDGPDTVIRCLDADSVLIQGFTPLGGYYENEQGLASVELPNLDPGLHHLSYHIARSSDRCAASKTFVYKIWPADSNSLSIPAIICQNNELISPVLIPQAQFYIDGLLQQQNSLLPASLSVGHHVAEMRWIKDASCLMSRIQSFFVADTPSLAIIPFQRICLDRDSLIISGGVPQGGQYLLDGQEQEYILPANPGMHSLAYQKVNSNGCRSVVYGHLEVNLPVKPGIWSSHGAMCSGDSLFLHTHYDSLYVFRNGSYYDATLNRVGAWVKHSGWYQFRWPENKWCALPSDSVYLERWPEIRYAIAFDSLPLCSSDTLRLSIATTDSVQWFLNDSALSDFPFVLANRMGRYNALIRDSRACLHHSDTVLINPEVKVLLEAEALRFCREDSLFLQVPPFAEIFWFKDDDTLNGFSSSQIYVSEPGRYKVKVRNEEQCTAWSNELQIEWHPTPQVRIQLTGDSVLCQGASNKLSTTAFETYKWYRNGEPMSESGRAILNTLAGVFQVEVTDENACHGISPPRQIQMIPMPDVNLGSPGIREYCYGDEVMLAIPALEGVTYQWFRNNQALEQENEAQLEVVQNGMYRVKASHQTCADSSENVMIYFVQAPEEPRLIIDGLDIVPSVSDSLIWFKNERWFMEQAGRLMNPGPGKYKAMRRTGNMCSVYSQEVYLGINGLEQVGHLQEFNLYPNPFGDYLFIAGKGKYQLLDEQGRILKMGELQQNVNRLTTADLSAGFYELILYSEMGLFRKAIVKH